MTISSLELSAKESESNLWMANQSDSGAIIIKILIRYAFLWKKYTLARLLFIYMQKLNVSKFGKVHGDLA